MGDDVKVMLYVCGLGILLIFVVVTWWRIYGDIFRPGTDWSKSDQNDWRDGYTKDGESKSDNDD